MDNDKNKWLIITSNVFIIIASIYLIHMVGDISYRYINSLNANPQLSFDQIFRWNAFLTDVANRGFRVLVLAGIGAILRGQIKG